MTTDVQEKKVRTIPELKAAMKAAAAADNFDQLRSLVQELAGIEAAEAKTKAEQLAKERIGRNTLLEGKLKSAFSGDVAMIRQFGPIARFTVDATTEEPVFTAVLGSASTPSHKSGTGTNGGRMGGKVAATYGRSLDSVFQEFATAQEHADYEAASNAEKRPDSAQYTVKRKVLDRVIKAGLIKPIG